MARAPNPLLSPMGGLRNLFEVFFHPGLACRCQALTLCVGLKGAHSRPLGHLHNFSAQNWSFLKRPSNTLVPTSRLSAPNRATIMQAYVDKLLLQVDILLVPLSQLGQRV